MCPVRCVTYVSGRSDSKELTKPLTVASYRCQLCFFLLHSNMNLSRFVRKTDMAHYTLIAHINAADRFSIATTCKPFLRHRVTDSSRKKANGLSPGKRGSRTNGF